jgi:hypothetical protein
LCFATSKGKLIVEYFSSIQKSESDPARASEVVASIPSYVLVVFRIVIQEETSSSFPDITVRLAVLLKCLRT